VPCAVQGGLDACFARVELYADERATGLRRLTRMGANASTLLDDDITEIVASSSFSKDEIEQLYSRFQKLDRNGSGTIDASEFLMIPELAMNPLVPRIVQLFDGVNFKEFVRLLSAFGKNAPREARIDFLFRFYDVDGDGVVSEADVNSIFRLLVGENLDDATLRRIVRQAMLDFGAGLEALDGGDESEELNGCSVQCRPLTREDFCRKLQNVELDRILQISV
jgi:serine/threonine-protein phosphatase 2B regulatory subunit